ncbi:MAG: hypothetical protein ACOZAL_02865 [Patescibacteria group bacterium]
MNLIEPTIDDLFSLVELGITFRKGHSQYLECDELIEDEKLKEIYSWAFLFAIQLKNQIFLKILKDPINGEIAGYIYGEIVNAETFYKNRQRGFIKEIYLQRQYRSFANFKALMDSFFDWLKNKKISIVEGEIDAKNQDLAMIYRHSKAKEKTTYFFLNLGDEKNGK